MNVSIVIADGCADMPCGAGWCLTDTTTAIGFTCECPEPYYGEYCEYSGTLLCKTCTLEIVRASMWLLFYFNHT